MAKFKDKEVWKIVIKLYWQNVLAKARDNNLPLYRLDMRKSFDRVVGIKVNNLLLSDKFKQDVEIAKRNIAKRQKKEKFKNVLNNPLVKDYIKNKKDIVAIYSDHINFGVRNHWAKCPMDIKILRILKNYKNGKIQISNNRNS